MSHLSLNGDSTDSAQREKYYYYCCCCLISNFKITAQVLVNTVLKLKVKTVEENVYCKRPDTVRNKMNSLLAHFKKYNSRPKCLILIACKVGPSSPEHGMSSGCGWSRWLPDMMVSCEYTE
jgi:hypothetical protein